MTFDEKNLEYNLSIIDSGFFNGLVECEGGEEIFFTNEKINRLYRLACIFVGLNLDDTTDDVLTETEIDYLILDRKYIEFRNTCNNFKYFTLCRGLKLGGLPFLKRYLWEKRTDEKFCFKLKDLDSNLGLIKLVGYEYIFAYNGRYRSDIKNMKNIRYLKLITHNVDCSHICELTNLQKLVIETKDPTPLKTLVNLKCLNLLLPVKDVSFLRFLTELRFLGIIYKEKTLEPLTSLKSLEELRLIGCYVNDISHLPLLSNLKQIDFSGNRVKDWTPVKSLPNLKTLYIHPNVLPFELPNVVVW